MDNISCIVPSTGVVTTDVTCNGDCDGTAKATMSFGQTPYTYQWSNGATTDSISGLCADTFYVTVTDANNQQLIDTGIVNEPPLLIATINSSTDVSCNGGNDGSASVLVSGGISPYSYLWSSGGSTNSETGLSQGNYYVTVTDSNGCTTIDTVQITEPPAMVLNNSTINVSCNGLTDGSASTTPGGGATPYSYNWSSGGNASTENNLGAGTYTVTVTDNNGCTSVSSVTITEPLLLVVSNIDSSDVACNGMANGFATISVSGGTSPFTYAWSSGGNIVLKVVYQVELIQLQ